MHAIELALIRKNKGQIELALIRKNKGQKEKVITTSIAHDLLSQTSAEHIVYEQGKFLFQQMEKHDNKESNLHDHVTDAMSYSASVIPEYADRQKGAEKPLYYQINEPIYRSVANVGEPLDELRYKVQKWLIAQ